MSSVCFFFNDTATTEIYTLSLHDALPICLRDAAREAQRVPAVVRAQADEDRGRPLPAQLQPQADQARRRRRSEEHTSELQSRQYLVCRLLLEKKKNKTII